MNVNVERIDALLSLIEGEECALVADYETIEKFVTEFSGNTWLIRGGKTLHLISVDVFEKMLTPFNSTEDEKRIILNQSKSK